MLIPRVIPCLLLRGMGLVKTHKFAKPRYVGDPRNAARIFNEREVDELVFLDITATSQNHAPRLDIFAEVASECFMPVAFGGGVRSVDQVKEIIAVGAEKVILNSHAVQRPGFVEEAANQVGSQSVVVCLDVRRNFFGKHQVFAAAGREKVSTDPIELARQMERAGAGELVVQSIDRDGTMSGYDLALIAAVADAVSIPVVALGGAGQVSDFAAAVEAGAAAAAAGSLFVFHGKERGVLINYPDRSQLETLFDPQPEPPLLRAG